MSNGILGGMGVEQGLIGVVQTKVAVERLNLTGYESIVGDTALFGFTGYSLRIWKPGSKTRKAKTHNVLIFELYNEETGLSVFGLTAPLNEILTEVEGK